MAAEVDAFLAGLPRTVVLEQSQGKAGRVWHARVVTRLWGFADDFFVRISCEPGLHQSTVEMQVSERCQMCLSHYATRRVSSMQLDWLPASPLYSASKPCTQLF